MYFYAPRRQILPFGFNVCRAAAVRLIPGVAARVAEMGVDVHQIWFEMSGV